MTSTRCRRLLTEWFTSTDPDPHFLAGPRRQLNLDRVTRRPASALRFGFLAVQALVSDSK
jgi:hypothetical protein